MWIKDFHTEKMDTIKINNKKHTHTHTHTHTYIILSTDCCFLSY